MLYHYTSLEALALILKSKTIKFNRMDLMDDPDESAFKYGDSEMWFNSSSFVSCWTRDKEENIALWKMYSNLRGVRIGLSQQMFITFGEGLKEYFFEKGRYEDEELVIVPYYNHTWPTPIKYDLIDDEHAKNVYKEIAKSRGGIVTVEHKEIGIHKKKYWEFQKEERFIIVGLSIIEHGEGVVKVGNGKVTREAFFIPLKDEALLNMEILLGPLSSEGDRIIVESLIQKFIGTEHHVKINHSIVKIKH